MINGVCVTRGKAGFSGFFLRSCDDIMSPVINLFYVA